MISDLHFRNFKCFDDVELNVRDLTLFAGLNGMGKSTALQTLLLLHQSQGHFPNSGIEQLILNGPLINVGRARDALWEGAEKDVISLGFSADREKFFWSFSYEEDSDELRNLDRKHELIPLHYGIFTSQFLYIGAERSGPRPFFPVSSALVRDERQIGVNGEYAPYFLNLFGAEEVFNRYLHHPRASSHQLRHQVEAWISEISPGTRIYTESHSKLDLVSLEYAFAGAVGETNHYRAVNVGFGLTYILPIVLALLSAKPGSLILLENPEAHLHPRGQTKMGEMLARCILAGVQILVETHSDHLLNGVRLAVHSGLVESRRIRLHMFGREEAEGVTRACIRTPEIDQSGRIDSWPDGFFDESEKALRQLLRPRQK